jgi:hypothetical protein
MQLVTETESSSNCAAKALDEIMQSFSFLSLSAGATTSRVV